MKTGWDQVRRAKLDEPWDSFWLDLLEDPPIGAWDAMREAFEEAASDPRPKPISRALATIGPLIAEHNLVDRAGVPMDFANGLSFPAGLFRAVVAAIQRELGGASAVPLSAKKASSRGPLSRARRSRPASPAGG